MGALLRVSDMVAEIKRMRVDARDQRQGFGRTLLEALELARGSLATGRYVSTRQPA